MSYMMNNEDHGHRPALPQCFFHSFILPAGGEGGHGNAAAALPSATSSTTRNCTCFAGLQHPPRAEEGAVPFKHCAHSKKELKIRHRAEFDREAARSAVEHMEELLAY